MDTKKLRQQTEEAVAEFGLKRYQEGLALGLDTARSFLASIESSEARAACKQQLKNTLRAAKLPEDLNFEVTVGGYEDEANE